MPGFRSLLVVLLLVPSLACAQVLSLTFDDGLDPVAEPQATAWNERILAALRAKEVTAMVFPSLRRIGGKPGIELIERWAASGHAVGNHTSEHRSLGSARVSLQEFIADVEVADAALRPLRTFQPMLRFPYLKEGNTAEKRDGMRAWLRAHGYRSAPVSIDTSDWYYNQVYMALGRSAAASTQARLRHAYVQHLLARAGYYERLALSFLHRSPGHVMLLHTNMLNADALTEVIDAFRARGWTFVAPLAAFADPVYAQTVDTLPAGESVLWAIAKAGGAADLRYPAEDGAYEEPRLRELGLLDRGG